MTLELPFTWHGPYTPEHVISKMRDAGSAPEYSGGDYGLYQIYGTHILAGPDSLIYIGRATHQTFSTRFQQHLDWLGAEEGVRVYLGRLFVPERHTAVDSWARWIADVCLAECVLIYKYSPHYNSVSISEPPQLGGWDRVILLHKGSRHRLSEQDVAPQDWQ